jgi:peptide/nickel transport system ATP-binding protein
MSQGEVLLEVRDLSVHFPTPDGVVKAVDGLSFTVHRRETFGIVGESGSGKSVTCLTALGLTNLERARVSGEVLFKGQNLLQISPEHMRSIRGKELAMIFQDPFACLHPFYRVGDQIVEAILTHERMPRRRAQERTPWASLVRRSGSAAILTSTPGACDSGR